jgi:branched-subunit amino acid ABC-type transport system permease component
MREDHDRPSAPNFTHACIVMFGVYIFWLFMVIWVVWGLLAVALCGWAVNLLINWIAQRLD